jgi:hypothetical protein
MCSQIQLDLVAALEALRKVQDDPKKFKKSPTDQLERRLMRSVEFVESEFRKVFEQIDEVFVTTSDEEFIDDNSPVSDDSSETEAEYLTSDNETSEHEEFVSSEEASDDEIEILKD